MESVRQILHFEYHGPTALQLCQSCDARFRPRLLDVREITLEYSAFQKNANFLALVPRVRSLTL